MKLFEMKNWVLTVSEEAWALSAFKKILDRDKSKDKTIALKEMSFIYFYSDIKSDYQYITNKEDRINEIIKDIDLPKNWKIDNVIQEAINLYEKLSKTIIQTLYTQTLKAASDIGEYFSNTKELLAERTSSGSTVTDISKITASIQRVPKLMADLKAAYKEVIKEQEDNVGKKKGSKTMGMFEDGL